MRFYSQELLATRPTPKPGKHPLSAVRDYLFNTFPATLHIGVRYSIRNLSTRHAVGDKDPLIRDSLNLFIQKKEGMAWLSKVYPDTVRVYTHAPDRWHAHVAL